MDISITFRLLSLSTLIVSSLFVAVCFLADRYFLDIINKQVENGLKDANESDRQKIMEYRLKSIQAYDKMRRSFRLLDNPNYDTIEMRVVWYMLIAGIVISVILFAIGISYA